MKLISSRFATRLLALGALTAIALPSMAKSTRMNGSKMSGSTMTSKKSSQMTGTVLSMTADTLTVKPSRKAMGATKTVSVPANAMISMGKTKCSFSDLKPGAKVTIHMNGMGTVTSIKCSMKGMSGSKMSGGSKMGGMTSKR